MNYVKKNNIILIGNYEKTNRESIIKGFCINKCGQIFEKNFRYLIENGGAYCKTCIKITSQEKSKNTCLNKYGVEFTSQTENHNSPTKTITVVAATTSAGYHTS